jgi:hypothetical protein
MFQINSLGVAIPDTFLQRHISHYWAAVQQSYYDSLGVDNTDLKWATQLLLKLFNTSWDMWELRKGINTKP